MLCKAASYGGGVDASLYCVGIGPLAMLKANDDVTIPKEELGAVSCVVHTHVV